ncbi:MAG: dinF [Bacteroidetes bacterium]|nr:dinF [Bacteroidota bacterium]
MNRRILKLAGPSILANITVPMVGIVDLAIAGRLGDAATIGGIAIGTMLFDLLYWNMGFLRVGTGGFTAQAYGRRDFRDSIRVLVQAVGTALISAFLILAIQYLYIEVAFKVVDCTPEVESLAKQYFFIRIWAAPATLSLFAFKGWFIGMQNTISPMIADIVVNVANLVYVVYLAIYLKMGVSGIALGTVLAQYTGLLVTISLLVVYYRKLFHYINFKTSLKLREMKNFFMLNGNLFIRSMCLLLVYTGFTSFAARYGDQLLAISTIMMKLMLLYSYFIDGFGYAGEALTGRYIGARDVVSLKSAIRNLFKWSFIIAGVSTLAYFLAGDSLFRLMTNNQDVISGSAQFMPWLLLIPVISCIAFMWDGIYTGATASAAIRNNMIASAFSFFATFYLFEPLIGIQSLYLAFSVHLLVRTVLMTAFAKKEVIGKALTPYIVKM